MTNQSVKQYVQRMVGRVNWRDDPGDDYLIQQERGRRLIKRYFGAAALKEWEAEKRLTLEIPLLFEGRAEVQRVQFAQTGQCYLLLFKEGEGPYRRHLCVEVNHSDLSYEDEVITLALFARTEPVLFSLMYDRDDRSLDTLSGWFDPEYAAEVDRMLKDAVERHKSRA